MSVPFRKGVLNDMKPVVHKLTTLELGLGTLIKQNFQNWMEFNVISNIKMYKPNADEFIYGQKLGNIPEICEVYLNGEYLCDVTINDTPSEALTKIQDGIIEVLRVKKVVEERKKEVS